jgi:uncharacterized phage-like protein YoqJ
MTTLTLPKPDANGGMVKPTHPSPPTCDLVLGVTGHRPHKLAPKPQCYSKAFRVGLTQFAMERLTDIQPEQVISGMALGWDQAVAIAAIKLGIPLIAAIPFKHQASRWPAPSQRRYHQILARAAHVEMVSKDGYSPKAMQARNEWIVHHSDHLLALCNPAQPGGTRHCLAYAAQQRVPIIHCWDAFTQTR